MSEAELAELRDPFAELLLKRGAFPLTLDALLAALDALGGGPGSIREQASYIVGEGSQIPWTPETASVERDLRLVVQRGSDDPTTSIFISTAPLPGSKEFFLQVLAWDPRALVFNYYMRFDSMWIWSGDSRHALDPASRGRGCFDSHVNGSMVMKELKAPWNNWHSTRASVEAAFAPGDPFRQSRLFRERKSAEIFARLVRAGVQLWDDARLAKATAADGTLGDVRGFMRQILEGTTKNLITSDSESRLVRPEGRLNLPLTFFLNSDALLNVLRLDPDISIPKVSGALYLESLRKYDFALTDDDQFRLPGDTFFAFLVPEPGLEDVDVVRALTQADVITRRFAASLLMVDFPNPIDSPRRRRLMQYVPATAQRGAGGSDLEDQILAAVTAAAGGLPEGSPERELLENWGAGEAGWRTAFSARIEGYFARVQERLTTEEGFDAYVRLAESRRRRFRRLPLNESSLLLPTTNMPPGMPELRMNEDGTVEEERGLIMTRATQGSAQATQLAAVLLTRFDPPGFLEDFNDEQKAAWSQWIAGRLDEARAGFPAQADGPREQFYNPLKQPTADDATTATITWIGFPRVLLLEEPSDLARWRRADSSRDRQDEYCEWSVERNADNKIKRVTFTCEGPEYWAFLAGSAPAKVLDLYRQFVSPDVAMEDLFDGEGQYISRNRWNSSTRDGVMHMIQGANTLGAEIELAGAATIVRVINGQVLTQEQELIRCSMYGVAERNSDPHIGASVNSLARQRADVTLANPVGVYFDRLVTAGWSTPDGSDPQSYWKYVRGAAESPVRAVYEVPPDKPFVVGDIRIGGQPIEFGAQIADFVNMKLVGLACRFNQSQVAPMTTCRTLVRVTAFKAPVASVEGALGERIRRSRA